VGEQSSRLRSPPAYDDLHSSNNVCLDLTNPYRSAAAVEISTAATVPRASSSETAPYVPFYTVLFRFMRETVTLAKFIGSHIQH